VATAGRGAAIVEPRPGLSIARGFAGLLMGGASLAAPLVIGSAMKIAYDLLLFGAFRRRTPPEER